MTTIDHPNDNTTIEKEINLRIEIDKLQRRLTVETIETRESFLKDAQQVVELRVELDRVQRKYEKQIKNLTDELRLEKERAAILEVELRVRIDRLERKVGRLVTTTSSNYNLLSSDNATTSREENLLNEQVDLRVRLDRLERKLSRANTITSPPQPSTSNNNQQQPPLIQLRATNSSSNTNQPDNTSLSNNNSTWNRSQQTSIIYGLEHAAREWPNKVAIYYRDWKKPSKSETIAWVGEWHSCTYQDFLKRVQHIGKSFIDSGAQPGKDSVLVLWLPPNQMEALALMFALMRQRLAIVWLDPRTMTLSQIISHVEFIAPRIVLATPGVSRMLRVVQTIGRRLRSLQIIVNPSKFDQQPATSSAAGEAAMLAAATTTTTPMHDEITDETALVVFTTGATGAPKPVRLTRRNLAAQADAYQRLAEIHGLGSAGSIIAVHAGMNFNALDLALGNTTICLPDPSNPGNIPPAWIVEIDHKFHPTVLTGSRIIWENLCKDAHVAKTIQHLRLGFSGGAPCTPTLHHEVCEIIKCLDEFISVYGCTEGLPLAYSGSKTTWNAEYEARCEKGDGIPLGTPCDGVRFKVLKLSMADTIDGTLMKEPQMHTWQDSFEAPRGEIGELVVCSYSVSPNYMTKSVAPTNLTKILSPTLDAVWHRTGDLVVQDSIDDGGQIWMLGRRTQVVKLAITTSPTTAGNSGGLGSPISNSIEIIPPVCIESIFDGKLGIRRSAFVGVGSISLSGNMTTTTPTNAEKPKPHRTTSSNNNNNNTNSNNGIVCKHAVLVVLMYDNMIVEHEAMVNLLQGTRWASVLVPNLKIIEWPHSEFPMDFRHASKINRTRLSEWAATHVLLSGE
jgi:acyl-CoA synthetase (AMP-forming)/AMP-acid ligase II